MKAQSLFLPLALGLAAALALPAQTPSTAIIADHRAVDGFVNIPPAYLAQVRQMLVYIAGESHSTAYGFGAELLAAQDVRCPAASAMMNDIQYAGDANPSYPTFDPHNPRLRVIRGYGGEDFWFASPQATTSLPATLTRYSSQGVNAIGFGWCWDMTWAPYTSNMATQRDPVYRVHWSGRSQGSPEGDRCWGLDASDSAITGNSVNLDTYLTATQSYVDYCATNHLTIRPFFTTGPIDDSNDYQAFDQNEKGYARELKHARIRAWVTAHNGVLFDFADILSHNNAGQAATSTWTDDLGASHSFPIFHTDNGVAPYGAYHFGEVGAIRIAKAMWWMLARLAGWDGRPSGTTDTQPPTVPAGLNATPTNSTTISLTWSASTDNIGVTLYRIYRATGAAALAPLGTSSTPAYTDATCAASTTYRYTVSALDASGNESPQSTPATATTPRSLEQWTPVLSEGFETPTTATYIYNPAATWQFIGNSGIQRNGSPWYVENAPEGVQTAFLQGHPGQGASILGAIQRNITLSAGTHVIRMRLARRANQIQPLRVSIDGTQLGSLITPASNSFVLYSTNQFTVAAGSHTVRIEATSNTADNSTMLDDLQILVANDSPPQDTTAPSIPTALRAWATSSTAVGLEWSASTDAVGVTGYRVYRDGAQVGTTSTISYNDTGLTPGTHYTYRVAAYDAAGNVSPLSEPVTGIASTAAVTLIPVPKEASYPPQSWTIAPADTCSIVIGAAATPPERCAAETLQRYLQRRFHLTVPIHHDEDTTADYIFLLGLPSSSPWVDRLATAHNLRVPATDGYAIRMVEENNQRIAVVCGSNPRSVIYGQDTLFQLFTKNSTTILLHHAIIRDWPSLEFRSGVSPFADGASRWLDSALYFQSGYLDAYMLGRLNTMDLHYGPYGEDEHQWATLSSGVPLGVRVRDEYKVKRGCFLWGSFNAHVNSPEAIATKQAIWNTYLNDYGVDGLWANLDDGGASTWSVDLLREFLAWAQNRGLPRNRLMLLPPYPDYETPSRNPASWTHQALRTLPELRDIRWVFTANPCPVNFASANDLGLTHPYLWWYNSPCQGWLNQGSSGYYFSGFSFDANNGDRRLPRYNEMYRLQDGWSSFYYPYSRTDADYTTSTPDGADWPNMERYCAGMYRWCYYDCPHEYMTMLTGFWTWNPAAFRHEAVQRRIYETVFGPERAPHAAAFDQHLFTLKAPADPNADPRTFTYNFFRPASARPWALQNEAYRPEAERRAREMSIALEALRHNPDTILDPQWYQDYYIAGMQEVVETVHRYLGLPYNAYIAWAATGFPSTDLANNAISGPLADPDASGLTNFQRYALGLPARGPVPAPVTHGTTSVGDQTYLTLSFNRLANAPGLTYTVEASTDLITWSAVPGLSYTAGTPTRVTAQDTVPLGRAGTTPRRFLRLRLTISP